MVSDAAEGVGRTWPDFAILTEFYLLSTVGVRLAPLKHVISRDFDRTVAGS